jgi:hypothetical protein
LVDSVRNLVPRIGRAGLSLAGLFFVLAFVDSAEAKKVVGGPAPETLTGTARADQIYGRGGGDSLFGRAGADLLLGGPGADSIEGGPGRDAIFGGPGSDRVFADDGFADQVDCGPGWDVAVVDQLDTVAPNCEVVKVGRSSPAPVPSPLPTPTPPAPAPSPGTSSTPEGHPTAADLAREREAREALERTVREGQEKTAAEAAERAAKEKQAAEERAAKEKQAAEEKAAQEKRAAEEKAAREAKEAEEKEKAVFREPIPTYEERPLAMFPEESGWTGNGVGSFEDAGPPFVVNGDRSYKIQTDGTGAASVATSPRLAPVDLTAAHVSVQGLVSFSGRLGQVRLRLSSGDIGTDYAEATVWDDGRDPTVLGGTFEYQSIPTAGFTEHGEVDWSRIDRAQLIVTDNGTGSVFLYVAGIYAVPTYRAPTISFAFDDGLESTIALGLKKLSASRIPATGYVIADAIGTPGFLTEEQLYTMRNLDKWEIGGHAYSIADHNAPNGFDGLTPEQLKADFDQMREWMFERGFAQRSFAYPQGAAGPEVRKYAQRDYCAARVTAEGPETISPRNPFVIRGFSIDSSQTRLAELEREVDRAVAQRSWLVLTFHNLVTGAPQQTTDFGYAEFSQLVDYVQGLRAAGKLQIRTVADAVGC